MKSIGEKILKLIYDMNFDGHPIIFHVFSNGGAFLYQHIALAIKRSNRPIQVKYIYMCTSNPNLIGIICTGSWYDI